MHPQIRFASAKVCWRVLKVFILNNFHWYISTQMTSG